MADGTANASVLYACVCVWVNVWVCLVILGLIIGYSLLYSAPVSRAEGLVTGMLNNNALHTTNYRIHCIVLIYEIFNIRIVQLLPLGVGRGGKLYSISLGIRFACYLQFWYNLASVFERASSATRSAAPLEFVLRRFLKRITRYT